MDKLQTTSTKDSVIGEHAPLNKHHVDVTMKWGGSVMAVKRLSDLGEITIGDGEEASFNITDAAIPSARFALVTLCSEGVRLNIAHGMKLFVDGEIRDQPCFDLALGEQARVWVGALEFVVQYTNRTAGLRVPLLRGLDHLYAQIFSFAMVLQLAVIAAMFLTPHFADHDDDDLKYELNRFDLSVSTPKKERVKVESTGKAAVRHKKKEGVFGEKKEKTNVTASASKKGAPRVEKNKREEDQKLVAAAMANLGLAGINVATDTVLGGGGSGLNTALNQLKGASLGAATGIGNGTRGTGYGGGGKGISIGVLGSGDGRGLGGGRDGVDVGRKGKGHTRVRPGNVVLVGSLSKAEIERVIRRAQSRIRHCYEQELQKNPNLSGKLVMRWSIAPTGRVAGAKAKQSTLQNSKVSACVTRVVKGLRFPEPKGGGKVFVTYPWVFASR